MSTRLLARGIGLVRISRKSKKHRYRYFFLEHVCQVFVSIFSNNFFSFLVYERAMSITRILIGVISMSGLTRGSLVVISNIWRGSRRWMMMYASASARKQNERDVKTMLAVNEGCCTGPFNSDQAYYPNKLCYFPTNMLRVCFGRLF